MKSLLAICVFVMIVLSSCTTHRHYYYSQGGKVPPGQAKKMYGTKSAKPFAPGQRKKYR